MTPGMLIAPVAAMMFGAVAGSFLSTAALRGAQGRSAIAGRSQCDQCRRPLGFHYTVPVMSYVALGGRCASCAAPISAAHLYGEVMGALAGVLVVMTTPPAVWPSALALAALLIFLAIFDARSLRIPDPGSLAVASLGLLVASTQGAAAEAIATALVTLALLCAVRGLFTRFKGEVGLGLGDVKLVAALSIWTGPLLTPVAIALSSALALAWLAARGRLRSHQRLAFGPFVGLVFWSLVLARSAG